MHSISSSRSRALGLLAAVLLVIVLAAACSSGDDDDVAAEPTPTEAPTEEPTASATPADPAAPDDSDPDGVPTIDVESALVGVDTETPPDPRFCEISGDINNADFQILYQAAIGADEEAQAEFDELFDEFESVAPEDLEADVIALREGLQLAIDVTVEAIETDGMVDRTQLQEDIAEIVGESAARLGAYDQVVCGNAVTGEPLS